MPKEVTETLLLFGPRVLTAFIWWRFLARRNPDLIKWRRIVLLCGLTANTVSTLLFLALDIHALMIARHLAPNTDLFQLYRHFVPGEFSLSGILCGLFGKGVIRVLVICDGILITVAWMMFAQAYY